MEATDKEYTLKIDGMTCAACVNRIENQVKKIPGISSISVNLATEKASITSDQTVSLEKLISTIEKAGYGALAYTPETLTHETEDKLAELKRERKLVITSAVLSLPLVIPMIAALFGDHMMLSMWWQLLLAVPVQFYIGARFYKSAWSAILARSGNMDLLVTIGTSAAFGLSLYNMFRLGESSIHHGLYFESSAVIITLVLFGKYLEKKAKMQTTSAISALQSLRPDMASVIRHNMEAQIPINEVRLKDIVIVRPGERIPVDGLVLKGSTQVDESLITGESLPVVKSAGDLVTGGSMNGEGAIEIETTAIGQETMLSKIIRLVETAQAKKAPIQRIVDKVSAVFVPVVIVIAAITLIVSGLVSGNWESAIINSVAVLVIACPCALGLATPTSIMVGTGLAAKVGILIKDAEALELTHSLTIVAFDKTGTLTTGRPVVEKIIAQNLTERELLIISAGLQSGSEHSLGQAVLNKARSESLVFSPATDVSAIAGKGLKGIINGQLYLLGSERLMIESGIATASLKSEALQLSNEGHTISYVARAEDNQLLGLISFSDQIKSTSKNTITHLHKLGVKTLMITGDNAGAAKKIADSLGIDDVRAHVLPDEKSKIIEELKREGHIVGMIGDGINDAPALALAHVGMAMATGTDVAMHTAQVTLMRGEPMLIKDAIEISKLTYRKIKQNLFWAFIYNILGIPLAALGYLNPVIAGAAMALSSVSVVSNALLLKRWSPASQKKEI